MIHEDFLFTAFSALLEPSNEWIADQLNFLRAKVLETDKPHKTAETWKRSVDEMQNEYEMLCGGFSTNAVSIRFIFTIYVDNVAYSI